MRKIFIIVKRVIKKVNKFISKNVEKDLFFYNKFDGE